MQDHPSGAVGDQRVDEVGRVADARFEQALELRLRLELPAGRAAPGPRQRLTGLGVDLLRDQLGLLGRVLDDHPGQLGQVDEGRAGHHDERQRDDPDHLFGPQAPAHRYAPYWFNLL